MDFLVFGGWQGLLEVVWICCWMRELTERVQSVARTRLEGAECYLVAWATNDGREHSPGGIISRKAGFHQPGAIVAHQSGGLLVVTHPGTASV